MSDKVFLKDYENVITEYYIKNDDVSKVTGSESNKKLENVKNKSKNPNKIIFKVEVPGGQASKEEEKNPKIFHSEKNINSITINNINSFSDENISMDLLQDYNKKYSDRDNELNKEFEALEDSDAEIFSNIGSNNPSFNRSLINYSNNIVKNPTENNVLNHSISQSIDDIEILSTKTIIIGKGLKD